MKKEVARTAKDAQKAYTDFKKDKNKSIEEQNFQLINEGERSR